MGCGRPWLYTQGQQPGEGVSSQKKFLASVERAGELLCGLVGESVHRIEAPSGVSGQRQEETSKSLLDAQEGDVKYRKLLRIGKLR